MIISRIPCPGHATNTPVWGKICHAAQATVCRESSVLRWHIYNLFINVQVVSYSSFSFFILTAAFTQYLKEQVQIPIGK